MNKYSELTETELLEMSKQIESKLMELECELQMIDSVLNTKQMKPNNPFYTRAHKQNVSFDNDRVLISGK